MPTSDQSATFLRTAIPGSMKGQGWSALIEALAACEQPAWDSATAVFDAMFVSTASGAFLDRRASGTGVERPVGVGIDDEHFRRLVAQVVSGKLTIPAILGVLEIFYGVDATHANAHSSAQPFHLVDGQKLTLTLDGLDTVTVTFRPADFGSIAAATAQEVVGVLNRQFALQGLRHFAQVETDQESGSVLAVVYSGTPGLRGSVVSLAGTSQATLGYPTTPASLLGQMRASWARSQGTSHVEILLPATTDVVGRTAATAAYLPPLLPVEGGPVRPDIGPYLYEGVGVGLPLTHICSDLTADIIAGHQYGLLPVADSSQFPDQDGYLVLAYGYEYQTGPVRYLSRAGALHLALDPSFTFPKDMPSGVSVNLLVSQEPREPVYGEVGQFWSTPSALGRIRCAEALDTILAAGFQATKRIRYPSDVGLGNAGSPTSGSTKLSDVVGCFASDDITRDLATAREG